MPQKKTIQMQQWKPTRHQLGGLTLIATQSGFTMRTLLVPNESIPEENSTHAATTAYILYFSRNTYFKLKNYDFKL